MTSNTPNVEFPVVFSQETENAAVMQMPPRLSVLEAVVFKTSYHQLLEGTVQPQEIVLDFNQTKFIDSSGVGALVNNLKSTRTHGKKLILKNVHPPVMAVLLMTGLDQVLTIECTPTTPETPSKSSTVSRPPETHPSLRCGVKRFVDIVGSLVGLVITGLLLIPIAIAIKLDSKGPIFFGQTRCGWMGRRFTIWKFRSMCNNAEVLKSQVKNQVSGAFFKNEDDPRITRVGRFLRRTSLDELPQFWNVLKGDMSLVGTRPPTPNEVEIYEVPEWQRLNVKPGMTGEWQVYGRSQVRKFEDVIRLDLRYQENWSLMYDFKLILQTILILFRKNSGAY
jgi:anti-anti-sigma factor